MDATKITIEGASGVFNATEVRNQLVYFSKFPEVQAVLGNFPLVAIGLLAIHTAILAVFTLKPNRALIDIIVAGIFCLLSSILSLANLISCKKDPFMNTGLSVSTAVMLVLAMSFKLFYLSRLSDQPGRSEMPVLAGNAFPSDKGNEKLEEGHIERVSEQENHQRSVLTQIFGKKSDTALHSGSWSRYGMLSIVREVLPAVVFLVMILSFVWRITFITQGVDGLGTYRAASAIEIVFLLIVLAHFISAAKSDLQPTPTRSNILYILPVVVAICLSIILEIVQMAVVNFKDTPFGRLLTAIELFIFLTFSTTSSLLHSHRDSFSFSRTRSWSDKQSIDAPRDTLPSMTISPFRVSRVGVGQRAVESTSGSSVLPGPTIRRASDAPSWASEALRTRKACTQVGADVAQSNGEVAAEAIHPPESPMDIDPCTKAALRNATNRQTALKKRNSAESAPLPPVPSVSPSATLLAGNPRQDSSETINTRQSQQPSILSLQSHLSDFSVSRFPMPPQNTDLDANSLYRYDTLLASPKLPSNPKESRTIKVQSTEFDLLSAALTPPPPFRKSSGCRDSLGSSASLGALEGNLAPPSGIAITSFIAPSGGGDKLTFPAPPNTTIFSNASDPPSSPASVVSDAQIILATRMNSLSRNRSISKSSSFHADPQIKSSLPVSPKDVRPALKSIRATKATGSVYSAQDSPVEENSRRRPLPSSEFYLNPRPVPVAAVAPLVTETSGNSDQATARPDRKPQIIKRTRSIKNNIRVVRQG